MRIHLVSADANNIYGLEYFIKKAFISLGHEVVEINYRVMSKEEVSTRIRFISDCDFLLMIKGEKVSPDDLFACRIPKVLWMQDSVEVNKEANFIIQTKSWVFDIVYSFSDYEIPFYKKFNKNVYWLPLAADPDTHYMNPFDKEIPVSFIGSMNTNRINMINYLLDCGIPVELYYTKENYCDKVNNTMINLNIGITLQGTQQRVFEILSMGGFLLTNKLQNDIEIFKDKEHLVYFDNFQHLAELINYYYFNPVEREKIAMAGRNEVLEKHTYKHRVQQIINDFNTLRS